MDFPSSVRYSIQNEWSNHKLMKKIIFLYYIGLISACCSSYGAAEYEQFVSKEAETALARRYITPTSRAEAAEQQCLLTIGKPLKDVITLHWEKEGVFYKSLQRFDRLNGREEGAQLFMKQAPTENVWTLIWGRCEGQPFEGVSLKAVKGSSLGRGKSVPPLPILDK